MNDSKIHVVCPNCDSVNRLPQSKLEAHPKCGRCGQPLFSAHPVELTDSNFQKHIQRNDIPVLVDFWAPWCGPCRMMAPAMEQAAAQLEPRIRVAKVNTEEARQVAGMYGIQSIPTVIVFRNGVEAARQSGAMDAGSLIAWANSI